MGEYDDLIAAAKGPGGGEYDDLIQAAKGKAAPTGNWNTGEGILPGKDSAPAPEPAFFSPEGGGTFTQRLGGAASAINSGLDTVTLGGFGAVNRLAGDPLSIARGIHEYRQAHPDLHPWTDAALTGPLSLEMEAPEALKAAGVAVKSYPLATTPLKAVAQLADRALPQVSNRVAQVARAGLAGAGAGAAASGVSALTGGASLSEAGAAAKEGGATGGLLGLGTASVAAPLGMLGDAVMKTRGAKARQTIESKGEGATVGVTTPGEGGIFDTALKGVELSSKGEGRAAFRGSKGLLNMHEQEWQDATGYTGFDYRRSLPDYRKEMGAARPQLTEEPVPKPELPLRPVRDDSAHVPAAEARLAEIEAKHRARKAPILEEQGNVDAEVADMPPRDATELEDVIKRDLYSARTSDRAAGKLQRALGILDRYRDNGTITPQERTQLEDFEKMRAQVKPGTASVAGLDRLIGELKAKAGTGKILMPEDELNNLRHYLYGGTSINTSDVRTASEAPQRRVAGSARGLVDEGPYSEVNAKWTEAFGERQADRKGLGLKKRPPSDRDVDVMKIAGRAGKAKYIQDRGAYQTESARLKAEHADKVARARAEYEAKVAHADDEEAARVEDFSSAKRRAAKPRSQLGLSEKPPSEARIDRGKLKRKLLDRTKDTHTAGDEEADIEGFLDEHGPAARRFADLPELAVARNELAFGSPGGDLLKATRSHRSHAGILGPLLNNLSPIQGRYLYPGAREALLAEMAHLRLNPLFQAALNRRGSDE